ncbi:MAG: hypothetical protein H7Y04_08515 [Verrucomicrobia bacterium]|nr:hypothetical protein [Cytophagales bacterium]
MKILITFFLISLFILNACYQAEVPDANSCKIARIDNFRTNFKNGVEVAQERVVAYDFEYDNIGNIKAFIGYEKNDLGKFEVEKKKTVFYDLKGNPIKIESLSSNSTIVSEYNAIATDEKGRIVKSESFSLQLSGFKLQNTDTYVYDSTGRLNTINRLITPNTTPLIIKFVYDTLGNIAESSFGSVNQAYKITGKFTAYDKEFNSTGSKNAVLISILRNEINGISFSKNNVMAYTTYNFNGTVNAEYRHTYQYNKQEFPFIVKITKIKPNENSISDYTVQYQCP